MIKLTIKQLSAIRALAAAKSFTVAASYLHTTQSNLSTTILEAESLLGARLFNRTTKEVSLTQTGKEFAVAVGRVLDELESHIENVAATSRLERGTLAVGVTPLLGSTLMPELLARFSDQYPAIDLRLDDDATAVLQSRLANRDIELAIGTFEDRAPHIDLLPLFNDALIVLSHPSLKFPAQISWAELAGHRLISIVSNSSVGRLVENTLWSLGETQIKPIIRSHHWLTVMSLTQAMRGACIVPRYAHTSEYGQALRQSELVDPDVSRCVHLASLKGRELSVAARQFVALLCDHFDLPEQG